MLYNFYARFIQFIFKLTIPFLPYRKPKIYNSLEEVSYILKDNKKIKPIIITGKNVSKKENFLKLLNILKNNNIEYHVFAEVQNNPTIDNVYQAKDVYDSNNCDSIIAYGGGSPMDCAKCLGAVIARPKKHLSKMKGLLKIRKKIPLLIAIPTTCGTGSEVTVAAVIVDNKNSTKYAISDFCLIPKYAILDYNLLKTLPKHLIIYTAFDALTHAIEAFIGRSTTKDSKNNSLLAIKLIFNNLDDAISYDDNALNNLLYASYYAGCAFTKSYVGYVHAIAHQLGAIYDLPHGYLNSVILPYVLKEYGNSIDNKLSKIYDYLKCGDLKDKKLKANYVLNMITSIHDKYNIDSHISLIRLEDIDKMSINAIKEANPLYPVPVIFNVDKIKEIYLKIKE